MYNQEHAPPVVYKINGVFPDCVRRRVLGKMFQLVDSSYVAHVAAGGQVPRDLYSYRFSSKDYAFICTDEYTGPKEIPEKPPDSDNESYRTISIDSPAPDSELDIYQYV